jgi:hypothetical protein
MCFQKSKRTFAFILVLLSWGILFAEGHGILGHAHSIPADAGTPACHPPSARYSMELTASAHDEDGHSCGLCYCFRLLGQSLVSQVSPVIDTSFDIRPIIVHRFCFVNPQTLKTESRSPPRV